MATYPEPASLALADLPPGRLAYRAAGPATSSRPPVVFVHGVLVDARLWDGVADRLAAEGIRSYAPTLPLGAHQSPMNPGADLSPRGMAQLVLDFIAALDLADVTIVGNDTGGAICQLLLDADTSRIGAAVLTNCDALGTFPPRALAPLFRALRHPGLVAGMAPALRLEKVRHGRLAYGPLSSDPIDPELTSAWIQPLASKEIRRDLARFARGCTRACSSMPPAGSASSPDRCGSSGARRPVLPDRTGPATKRGVPARHFTAVPGGRTFLPLDHPDRVASEIVAAVRDARPARPAG